MRIFALLLLVSCLGERDDSIGDADTDSDPPVAPGTHFEDSSTDWSVLDGDGRPDLVNAGEYVDGSPYAWGVDGGEPHWKVYGNQP